MVVHFVQGTRSSLTAEKETYVIDGEGLGLVIVVILLEMMMAWTESLTTEFRN